MLKLVAVCRRSFNPECLTRKNYSVKKPKKQELTSFSLKRGDYSPETVQIPEVPREIRQIYKESIPSVGQPISELWEPGRGLVDREGLPTRKEVRETMKGLKKEFGVWAGEIKEGWKHDPEVFFRDGEINKVWTFNKKGCLKDFAYTNDTEHEFGYSACTLSTTTSGTLLFKGNLSTSIRDDGKTVRSGFCSFRTPRAVKSFQRKWFYDWGMYTHVVLKVRGDGRYYLINLGQDDDYDHSWYDMQSYFLFTRGGPYWQTIKIPFSKFVFTHKGKIQDRQPDVETTRITFLGITLCDDVDGPFQLEIEYIGTMYDSNHLEESAYEEYDNTKPAFELW